MGRIVGEPKKGRGSGRMLGVEIYPLQGSEFRQEDFIGKKISGSAVNGGRWGSEYSPANKIFLSKRIRA